MVNQVINGLIAGIVGAVAFLAVKAMVSGNIYGAYNNLSYDGAQTANITCNPAGGTTAGEMLIHDILPLAIAIMVVAGLFLGLTRVKGV